MQAIFGHLRRLDDGLARIEGLFLVATLTCMILLSIAQIILRNFFETSIPHGDVVNRHLVLWICFLGASMAAYRRRHIDPRFERPGQGCGGNSTGSGVGVRVLSPVSGQLCVCRG